MNEKQLIEQLKEVKNWIFKLIVEYDHFKKPVSKYSFENLLQYFSFETLNESYVIITDRIPLIPFNQLGLDQFSIYGLKPFIGMTYMNCYFIREGNEKNESLHFHELIHILQWKFLGVDRFIKSYALGLLKYEYDENPLEKMAMKYQFKFEEKILFDAEKCVFNDLS